MYYTGTIGGQAQKATINKNRISAQLMTAYLDYMPTSDGADTIARLSARYSNYLPEILSIAHVVADVKGEGFAHALRATSWQIKHAIAYGKTGSLADAVEQVRQWADNRCNGDRDYIQRGKRGEQKMRIKRNMQILDDTEISFIDTNYARAEIIYTIKTLRRKLDNRTRARITRMVDSSRGAGTTDPIFDTVTGEINAERYDARIRKFASRFAMIAQTILGLDSRPDAQALLRACILYWNE